MENRVETALFLIKEGYTAKEIVDICGYSNISSVFNLAKSHGLKVQKANSKKHEQMRQYKAEGHTMPEVADKFGVSIGTAHNICKGINPQKSTPPKWTPHPCPVCGEITDRKRYCSDICRVRANSLVWNTRRRTKLQDALVDNDITLYDLFERDGGRCHLCDGLCDWKDHSYKNNHFVAGKNYPTIDHVVPLVLGGEHSWSNVKLAHFSCNSAKGASVNG